MNLQPVILYLKSYVLSLNIRPFLQTLTQQSQH